MIKLDMANFFQKLLCAFLCSGFITNSAEAQNRPVKERQRDCLNRLNSDSNSNTPSLNLEAQEFETPNSTPSQPTNIEHSKLSEQLNHAIFLGLTQGSAALEVTHAINNLFAVFFEQGKTAFGDFYSEEFLDVKKKLAVITGEENHAYKKIHTIEKKLSPSFWQLFFEKSEGLRKEQIRQLSSELVQCRTIIKHCVNEVREKLQKYSEEYQAFKILLAELHQGRSELSQFLDEFKFRADFYNPEIQSAFQILRMKENQIQALVAVFEGENAKRASELNLALIQIQAVDFDLMNSFLSLVRAGAPAELLTDAPSITKEILDFSDSSEPALRQELKDLLAAGPPLMSAEAKIKKLDDLRLKSFNRIEVLEILRQLPRVTLVGNDESLAWSELMSHPAILKKWRISRGTHWRSYDINIVYCLLYYMESKTDLTAKNKEKLSKLAIDIIQSSKSWSANAAGYQPEFKNDVINVILSIINGSEFKRRVL